MPGAGATVVAELQDGPWRDALAGLDPHEVVAMRLLDGGGLSVVTSDRRRMLDCVLAMRIMLHQMQKGGTHLNVTLALFLPTAALRTSYDPALLPPRDDPDLGPGRRAFAPTRK